MSSVGSPCSTSVICEEVFDDGYQPSHDEITDYALKIGINPTKETHLLYLAREGLIQALPSDWKICYNDQLHAHYYYNESSKATQWDHPLDAVYRDLAEKARQKYQITNPAVDLSDDVSQLDSGIRSLLGNEDIDSSVTNNDIISVPSTGSNSTFKMPIFNGQGSRFMDGSSSRPSTLKPIKNSRFEVVRTSPQISLDMRIRNSDNNQDDGGQLKIGKLSQDDGGGGGGGLVQDKKGFQISGMGSMFLKSNTRKIGGTEDNDKTQFFVEQTQLSVKGILRDSSLTDVRRRFDDNGEASGGGSEDKKSVRFNLDDSKLRTNFSPPDDDASSSKRFTHSPEISDNSDDDPWDFMEEDDNEAEKHVKNVKVTPVVPKIPSTAPVTILKPLLRSAASIEAGDAGTNTPAIITFNTFGKPVIPSRENLMEKTQSSILSKMKERTLVRPMYEDTDSDSRGSSVRSFIQKDKNPNFDTNDKNKIDLDKLARDHEKNLQTLRLKFAAETEFEERKLRAEMLKNLEEIKAKCLRANETELNILTDHMKNNEAQKFQIKSAENIKLAALSLNNELTELKQEHEETLANTKRQFEIQLSQVKETFEQENNQKLEEYRLSLEEQFNERRTQITSDHKKTMTTLQKNHSEILQELERDLKSEEEILKKEHITKLSDMRDKLNHEVDMERTRMRESGEDRLYEKIRCEKRLLEDKYRCLKEKYVRLKNDVKLSLERRNRRREQQTVQQQSLTTTTTTTGSETERSLSNKPSIGNSDIKSTSLSASYPVEHGKPPTTTTSSKSHNLHPREHHSRDRSADRHHHQSRKLGIASKYIKQLQAQYQDDTTSISQSDTTISNNYPKGKYLPVAYNSDNGNSDSEAVKRNNQENNNNPRDRQRKKLFTRMKSASTSRLNTENFKTDRPCTPVENLRRQLEKLEDLEDQFPDNTLDATYHLRYPFSDISNDHPGTSSELEFFKHRIHLERDSVRRAKESLRTQRTNFRVRQREIKQRHKQMNHHRHTIDQVILEEKELTEMEVNLHRTRALLGEKVIRLRHLEQSLQRIYEKEKPTDLLHVETKDDATLSDLSSHSSSGFSSTDFASDTNAHLNRRKDLYQDSSEAIQNLEILNVEIREILDILGKQQIHGGTSFSPSDLNWTTAALMTPSSASTHHGPTTSILQAPQSIPTLADRLETYRQLATGRVQTSMGGAMLAANTIVSQNPRAVNYTTSLVERTRDLRNWLRQAKNEHDILLGANITVLSGTNDIGLGINATGAGHQTNL